MESEMKKYAYIIVVFILIVTIPLAFAQESGQGSGGVSAVINLSAFRQDLGVADQKSIDAAISYLKQKFGEKSYPIYAASETSSDDFNIKVEMDHSGVLGDYDINIIADENIDIQKNDYVYLLKYDGIIQYLGADKKSYDNPVMRFRDMQTGKVIEFGYILGSADIATATLHLGGFDYKIISSSGINQNDFLIKMDLDENGVLQDFNLGTVMGNEDGTISKGYYFFLKDYGMLQYIGADKSFADNPELRFKALKTGSVIEQPYSSSNPIAILKLGAYFNLFIRFVSAQSYKSCTNECKIINEINFDYKQDLPIKTSLFFTVYVDDKQKIIDYVGPSKPYKFLLSENDAIAAAKVYGLKNITGTQIFPSHEKEYELVWIVWSNELAEECQSGFDAEGGPIPNKLLPPQAQCKKGVYVDVDTSEIRGEFVTNPLILAPSEGVILNKPTREEKSPEEKEEISVNAEEQAQTRNIQDMQIQPQKEQKVGFFRKIINWFSRLFS